LPTALVRIPYGRTGPVTQTARPPAERGFRVPVQSTRFATAVGEAGERHEERCRSEAVAVP